MDTAEPFPDNWTYLRTELNWLDRVLANAIARQRKESKEIERVSRSKADAVTSHWWKGLVTVDGLVAGDSPAELPRRRPGNKTSYQQQMEARIRASRNQGIVLGLPSLCQRLNLSTFEKNTVLMALAPEINRRYARMYNFLQEVEQSGAAGLPTVDLILRLLCRNDTEWRTARLSLAAGSRLVQYGILGFPTNQTEPFLAHVVKLSDPCVEYLLAETPALIELENLLAGPGARREFSVPASTALTCQGTEVAAEAWQPERAIAPPMLPQLAPLVTRIPLGPGESDPWRSLVFPEAVLATLYHWRDRLCYAQQVDITWGFGTPPQPSAHRPGTIALLTGAPGTGKTTAARAIAQSLGMPLYGVDLAQVEPTQMEDLLHQLQTERPTILLIKSAALWLGRFPVVPAAQLHQFLSHRQQQASLTLFSVPAVNGVKLHWRHHITEQVSLPFPNQAARRQLWLHAFPPQAPIAESVDWAMLATWRLTGKEIAAIAREAAIYAAAAQAEAITTSHITQAYARYQAQFGLRRVAHPPRGGDRSLD